MGSGSGSRTPGVVDRHQVAQHVDGRVLRRPSAARCGALPGRRARPMHTADQSRSRMMSEQRQQRNPRREQVLGRRAWSSVTDTSVVAEHRRHRARQPPARAEVDVDVVGVRRRPCGTPARSSANGVGLVAQLRRPCASPAAPGGSVPRRHSACRASSGVMPRSMSPSIRSPTAHCSRASMSTEISSETPSTSHGSV